MKKKLWLLFISFCFLSCSREKKVEIIEKTTKDTISEEKGLSYISHNIKLSMIRVDDKCGEWGGDSDKLIFYRDTIDNKALFADYTKIRLTCKRLIEDSTLVTRIKVSKKAERLIVESVRELSKIKITRKNYASHSGLYNMIMLSDSSLIVYDFPSERWRGFEKLILELKLSRFTE